MIKKWNDYDSTTLLTDNEQLPAGGYVCKIMDAKVQQAPYADTLLLSVDVCEGEKTGFYAKNYKQQQKDNKKWKGCIRIRLPKDDGSEKDDFTKRVFKTAVMNIENSNKNYHWNWDEVSIKGLVVGVLARNKEYDFNGHTGFWTELFKTVPADVIRSGEFAIPEDKLLEPNPVANQFGSSPADYYANSGNFQQPMKELDESEEELPF